MFFPVPCWGSGLPPRPLLRVWGCLGYPALLLPAGVLYLGRWLNLRPAAAGALLPGGPPWSCGSWEVLGSFHGAPLAVGPLPGPPALLCLRSAGCFLGLQLSPSGEVSASAWRFSWHPVAADALAVILPAATSRRGFFPLCLVCHLSRVCSSVGGPVGVAHSFHPSLLLGDGLVRFCGGLCWRSLAMSWACPQPFYCVGLVGRSHRIVAPRVFADGFRLWCAFRLCGGASPHAFGSVGALGELRWLHLYRLTPDLVGLRQFAVWLWSSGRCFLFSCATFRTYTWRSFCQFPWLLRIPASYLHRVLFLGHLTRRVTGLTLCPPPRSSRILPFALTYSHDSLILMHPAIDIVWRCPCISRLRLLWPLAIAVRLVVFRPGWLLTLSLTGS